MFIPINFPGMQLFKRKNKMMDELQAETPITDSEKHFQVEVFNQSLDIMKMQLKESFRAINVIFLSFQCLKPLFVLSSDDWAILEASELLVQNHSSDISPGVGP